MQLYGSVNSPYARKCRVVLREKRIACDEILLNALDNPAELLAVNPLGKVPVLVTHMGQSLCDSSLICEYLDGLSSPPIIPVCAGRLQVMALAVLADGVMDLAVEWVMQTRRAPEQQWPDWIARRREGIMRTLAVIAHDPLLDEPSLTLAHINVACMLDYLRFRHPTLEWEVSYPKLGMFLAAFSKRPSMLDTQPKA